VRVSVAKQFSDLAGIGGGAAGAAVRRVMVVDDSRMQRRILSASLSRLGYEVVEAASGAEALALCRAVAVDIVLSDWMMPGMSGVDFCRAFRRLPRESYGYFILLTSRSGKEDAAHGLDAGADDFLTKPVTAGELRARLGAGERILRMERELVEKNRAVSAALSELRQLYGALDRDLTEARRLQQSLVPEGTQRFGAFRVSLMLRASGHVGGDLVGCFPAGDGQVGVFGLDVSGHGVASALLAARLAGALGGTAPEQNVALARNPDGGLGPRPPHEVAARLNQMFLDEAGGQYFTLALALLDTGTGRVTMVQAGHPHPALQRCDGSVDFVGSGGLPVALLEGARFQSFALRLAPGERLLIHSDGLTECPTGSGGQLREEGLARLMRRHGTLRGAEFLNTLDWELRLAAAGHEFPDDLSAALVEYAGPDDS